MKRMVALALAILLFAIAMPISVNAAGGVSDRLNSLRSKFPDGKYWNHYCNEYHNNNGPFDTCTSSKCMNPDGWTNTPCTSHNSIVKKGGYDCNCFDGGIQCLGFANKIFYDVFGVYASAMVKRYDTANVSVGDWIRVENDNHSAVVLSRNGNNITIVEGNRERYCMIKWDRTISINSINYYKHASNWESVNGTSLPVSVKWSTFNEKHNIGETNAVLAKRVDISGANNSDVTKIGIYLYDVNDKLLSSFSEKPSVTGTTNPYVLMWYDVNLSTELNYKLTHNTTYKYKMFVVVKGETYYSSLETFKTNEGTHSYGAWQTVKAATCTADGSKKAVCVCGVSKTETIPAIGHSWNSGTVTTAATCVSTGVKTYTCTACKTTKTETIAKEPSKHTGELEVKNAIEATYERDGYTGDVYCKGCDVKLESGEIIPKLESEYIPGDINNDGKVNNKDLTRLMKYLAGEDVEVVEKALDVNGDKKVNSKDLTRLMKYLAGENVIIL